MTTFDLNHVYSLDASGEKARALTYIVDTMDRMFAEGQFSAADAILAAVNVSWLSSAARTCFLMVSKPAADRLINREAFFGRVMSAHVEQFGEDDAVKRLRNLH